MASMRVTMRVTMGVTMGMGVRISFLVLLLCSAVADLRDVVLLLLLGQVGEVAVGGPGEAVTVSVAAPVLEQIFLKLEMFFSTI